MEDKEFLQRLREYIEQAAASLEAEFGNGRGLGELIDAGEMPDVYAEVLRRLELDNQATERERCAAKLTQAEYLIGAFERGADAADYSRAIAEFRA